MKVYTWGRPIRESGQSQRNILIKHPSEKCKSHYLNQWFSAIISGWRSLAGEKKRRPFMKNGELSEMVRASKQCRAVTGVQRTERREEAALWAAGERLHLVANEPLTGSDVLISSVCFHRPLCVNSTIVLLGRPYRRSQALGPYLSSDCPVFFFLEFMGLNIICPSFSPSRLHRDRQWFSVTSVRRDRLGVFPIALTFSGGGPMNAIRTGCSTNIL